jgi:Rps23 Pro-64 3,4-dihydroxylase Tpa1-like proline 4-hydroxylase
MTTAMLTDCLLNSIFGPEYGGNMLLRDLLPNYTASHTRSQYSPVFFSCTDYLFYN